MDKTIAVPSQVSQIAQILKLTQDEKIQWELGGPDSIGKGFENERVDAVFLATYKGTNLKFVSVANKTYFSELASNPNQFPLMGARQEPIYSKYNILEIIDEHGKVVWRFPRLDILDDLETTIRYQVAHIKDFIDDIFMEP